MPSLRGPLFQAGSQRGRKALAPGRSGDPKASRCFATAEAREGDAWRRANDSQHDANVPRAARASARARGASSPCGCGGPFSFACGGVSPPGSLASSPLPATCSFSTARSRARSRAGVGPCQRAFTPRQLSSTRARRCRNAMPWRSSRGSATGRWSSRTRPAVGRHEATPCAPCCDPSASATASGANFPLPSSSTNTA